MVHLDINFEGLSLRSIFLSEAHTHRMVLNAIKIFAIGLTKGINLQVFLFNILICNLIEKFQF